MTTLLPTLKVKNLLSQLGDQDFDGVFTKLRESFGRDYMMEMICSSMTSLSRDTITRTVTTIVRERDQCRDSVLPDKQHIAKLPTSLVGETASYLDQESYHRFAATNRKMFVDCHSPNRLTKLDLTKLTDYSPISLQNYPKVSHLLLRLPHIVSFGTEGIAAHCRRLKFILLLIDGVGAHFTDAGTLQTELERFMINNTGGFDNVRRLSIHQRESVHTLQSPLLIRFLSLFPNQNNLMLGGIGFSTVSMAQQLVNVCPSVQQLFCNGVPGDTSILRTSSPALHTLTLLLGSDTDIPSTDWSKLRRLSLLAPTRNVMNQFLENGNGLKQICLVPNVSSP